MQIRLFPLFLFLACAFFAACQPPPLAHLPDGLTAERLAAVAENSPLALSPDGADVAFVDRGLTFLHLPTRQRVEVAGEPPRCLAWSPDGSRLAAAAGLGGKTIVTLRDRNGLKRAETEVAGEVTDLAWLSDEELLAGSMAITDYRFGSNVKTLLHRWQPGRPVGEATVLRDTTVRPATAKAKRSDLARGPRFDVADGSLLYLHPIDPPFFSPACRLILRDLASGREREIGEVDVASAGGRFTEDGERIVYGSGSETATVDPWTGETAATVATPGRSLAVSPGEYLVADGSLYRGTLRVAPLPGTARFTPDGRGLLVAAKGSLYLVSGLRPPGQGSVSPTDREKLRRLRSWRFEELITPQEYRDARERMKQP